MPDSHRFGVVTLVGRPNVGKSSLLNTLMGTKGSIVSRRPQTTWSRIDGIRTDTHVQLVIADTPGLHRPRRKLLNRIANQSARGSAAGADLVCQVIDARTWNSRDVAVAEHFSAQGFQLWLVLNKVDLLNDLNQVLPRIEAVRTHQSWAQIVPVSAKTGYNCERLFELLAEAAPIGDPSYPADEVTTASSRFIAAEFIREQIFRQMGDEIPYGSAVELTHFEEQAGESVRLEASIWCETVGQKAALIGAGGVRLKSIGIAARHQLERVLGQQVHLVTRVKVRKGWADDRKSVTQLGYGN